MEERPDSALDLLKHYDGAEIRSEEQRARFALLYSMALDKNYIDTANFNVLQPALDYYPTHGTDADKLRTLYYEGRIYENAKQMDKAMEAWAEALQYRGPKTDSLTLARLLVNQGNEYYRLYQFDKYNDNIREAEKIYNTSGRKDLADKAFLNQFELSLNRDSSYAKENIGRVENLALDTLSPNAELARSKALQYEMHFGSTESLNSRLNTYNGLAIDSLDLTQVLITLGRINEAESVLLHTQPDDEFQIKYLLRKLRIAKAKGKFEEALATSEEILKTFDQEQSSIIQEDRQYAEERYQWNQKVKRYKKAEKDAWIISTTVILILCLSACVLYYRNRLRIEKKEKNIACLLAELGSLKEALRIVSEPELRESIFRRIQILSPLSLENEKNCTSVQLKRLIEERKQFARDTRHALTISHPKFIAELKKLNLDDEELDYVSLYAIGMSGKEVGVFLQSAGHYHLSGRVREKFGYGKSGPILRNLIMDLMKKSGDF